MKNKNNLNKILYFILPILVLACLTMIWWMFSAKIGDDIILPTPIEAIKEVFAELGKNSFYSAFFATLLRSIVAFILSFVFAIVFAFLSKFNDYCRRAIEPIIAIIRSLPTIAVILLLVLWTDSQIAPVVITMLVILPTLYTGILSSLDEIDLGLFEMCKIYNVSKKQVFFKVIMPGIMPNLLILIGSGISLNIKLMVAAEVLAVTANSIGGKLNLANIYFMTANLFALVILIIATCVIVEFVFKIISKKVGKWK